MTKIIKCSECGEYKPHYAKGLCTKCYTKLRKYNKFGIKKYRIKIDGYWMIYKPHYKYSNDLGYVLEHRYIMHIYLSIKYNRIIYLPTKYEIHHINENRFDNRIENLQLLTKSKHKGIHNPRIDRTNTFCNICKTKETRKILYRNGRYYDNWYDDINGFLCHACFMMIYKLRKKLGIQNYI